MEVKVYKMLWMREYRKRKRRERLLSAGHCPVCTMLLDSPYHTGTLAIATFGTTCIYLTWNHIHAEIEKTQIIVSN